MDLFPLLIIHCDFSPKLSNTHSSQVTLRNNEECPANYLKSAPSRCCEREREPCLPIKEEEDDEEENDPQLGII